MTEECGCPRYKHPHGTYGRYRQHECRCFPCRLAGAERKHTGDQVFVPPVGMQRRLQALAAVGWGSSRIAAAVGVSPKRVEQWRDGKYDAVHPSTIDRVRAVYDDLWDKTPPRDCKGDRISVERSKRHAQRRGWLPPLAWDDDTIDDPHACAQHVHVLLENDDDFATRLGRTSIAERLAQQGPIDDVAVERAIQGDPVRLTPAEVSQVIRTMTGMGHSAAQIADRLRLSERTVQRWRDQGHAA